MAVYGRLRDVEIKFDGDYYVPMNSGKVYIKLDGWQQRDVDTTGSCILDLNVHINIFKLDSEFSEYGIRVKYKDLDLTNLFTPEEWSSECEEEYYKMWGMI